MCPIINPPTKLKTFKNDLAPVGFFFDIFTTDLFNIPVLPVPMRIDKVTNGKPTYLVLPDMDNLNPLFEELNLEVNFIDFYSIGIKNFINYAKIKYKEITHRELNKIVVYKWFEKSLNLKPEYALFSEEFTFIFREFLVLYSKYIHDLDNYMDIEDQRSLLIEYCDVIIKYFQEKIEKNEFQIEKAGITEIREIYREKKQKYYPVIIPIKVENLNNKKVRTMTFIPYLIFEDILEVFWYNKKLLQGKNEEMARLMIWDNKRIINKDPKTYKINREINLKQINLEELL
ncbi:MAG: hypothetical protein ACFFD5_12775 [Candidatus Thorarchaeota archaeon]